MATGGTSWLRRTTCPFDKPWCHGGYVQQASCKRCTCRYRHAPIHIPDEDARLYDIRRAARGSAEIRDYEASVRKILKVTWRMWTTAIKMQRAARAIGVVRHVRLAALRSKRLAVRLADRLALQGYVPRQAAPPG